jgi:hypothetical protein
MRDRMTRLAAIALLCATLLATAGPVLSAFTDATRAAGTFEAAAVFPPRNVTPPAVTGTARAGETLTGHPGTWARGTDAIEIEWLRCDDRGCTAVSRGTTRTLEAADVGHRMRIRVTARNAGGSATATSAPTETVVAPPPPANTAPPSIAGTARVGEELSAGEGTWTNRPTAHRYRWLRCTPDCAPIAGETERAYLLTGDDAAATLRVEVTAENAGGSASATSAATAAVERATFTHVLCRNPATGASAAGDGALPDGLTFGHNVGAFPPPTTRCASGDGIDLNTGGSWTTSEGDTGGWLHYRATDDLRFAGATIYRHARMGGLFSWAIHMATWNGIFAAPRAEICSWGDHCTLLGTPWVPFDPANRVDVPSGTVNGFNVVLVCDIPAGRTCFASGGERVVVTGGLVKLRDTATPRLEGPATGGLAEPSPLAGTEDLQFVAGDAGSGLYRLRVTVGGREVAERRLGGASATCTDADPSNENPFEFTRRSPCPGSLSASVQLDTASWPKTGRLRVYLEDAGRNTTTIVSRELGG